MSIIGTLTPDESKDFTLDWSKDLGGDTIAANGSSWLVSPSGMVVMQSSFAGSVTTVRLSGGLPGQVYQARNSIVTTSGRDMTKTIRLLVSPNNYV